MGILGRIFMWYSHNSNHFNNGITAKISNVSNIIKQIVIILWVISSKKFLINIKYKKLINARNFY